MFWWQISAMHYIYYINRSIANVQKLIKLIWAIDQQHTAYYVLWQELGANHDV